MISGHGSVNTAVEYLRESSLFGVIEPRRVDFFYLLWIDHLNCLLKFPVHFLVEEKRQTKHKAVQSVKDERDFHKAGSGLEVGIGQKLREELTGKCQKPNDPILKIVVISVNWVNDKNENESVDKDGRELHVIVGAPENGDGHDDDKRKDEEEIVQSVDNRGSELVDPEECVSPHDLVLYGIRAVAPVKQKHVQSQHYYEHQEQHRLLDRILLLPNLHYEPVSKCYCYIFKY